MKDAHAQRPASLAGLTPVLTRILADPATPETIRRLKTEILSASAPFVWSTLDIDPYRALLPPEILSAWIFVLKRNTHSVSHYHPNSIQHMAVIEGAGESEIGGVRETLRMFDSSDISAWYVIGKNVPHEFFPAEREVVVISFHTTAADELMEIEAHGERQRVYETQ